MVSSNKHGKPAVKFTLNYLLTVIPLESFEINFKNVTMEKEKCPREATIISTEHLQLSEEATAIGKLVKWNSLTYFTGRMSL